MTLPTKKRHDLKLAPVLNTVNTAFAGNLMEALAEAASKKPLRNSSNSGVPAAFNWNADWQKFPAYTTAVLFTPQ